MHVDIHLDLQNVLNFELHFGKCGIRIRTLASAWGFPSTKNSATHIAQTTPLEHMHIIRPCRMGGTLVFQTCESNCFIGSDVTRYFAF